MTWLDHYRRRYFPLLDITFLGTKDVLEPGMYNRALGFDLIWRLLLSQRRSDFHIIETGVMRQIGHWLDGQSSWLFTEFVDTVGGSVTSVDLDPDACVHARNKINSGRFNVTCSDSVEWLGRQTNLQNIDLFYLDSYDIDWHKDAPSAEHHLREFQIIEPHLRPGAVVAIDDNSRWLDTDLRAGKGRRIVEYLSDQGRVPLYDQYQIIFQF